MDEPIPTRDQYQEAYDTTVYDDPMLEADRLFRVFVNRMADPFYRFENWLSRVTSAAARRFFNALDNADSWLRGLLVRSDEE